jgi:hypothetical protein
MTSSVAVGYQAGIPVNTGKPVGRGGSGPCRLAKGGGHHQLHCKKYVKPKKPFLGIFHPIRGNFAKV